MRQWYSRARARDWEGLQNDWEQMTVPIEAPETGALVQFKNQDGSFGLGVLPNAQTLITVRHYGRLIVGPLAACGNLKLHRLK